MTPLGAITSCDQNGPCRGQKTAHQVYAIIIFFLTLTSENADAKHSHNLMKSLNIKFFFLCGLFLFCFPSLSLAVTEQNPEIKDIIVTTSDNDLLLFATVKNCFTPEMLDDLRNGIPAVFTYHLKLVKTSNNWIDTSLVEAFVTHTMTFDRSRKEYRIAFSNQDGKNVTTGDLEQAKQLMAELNGLKVIPLNQLVPGAPYAIHFKVTLKKGSLPFGMQRIIPFSSLWDFETDWRTIEFRY